ncbi:hypothetical protein LTS02_015775 [Friedmanniomyces endolithicus]|nr:hypothetical protein LTS02_015775 [Friedmanniomyces endolithicus]
MYMQIDDQRMRATAHNQKYERQCKAKDDRCAPSPGLQSERSNGTRDGDFHIETNKFQAQFYWRRVWFIVACPDAGVRRIECLILSVHRLVHFEDMESSLRYAFTDTGAAAFSIARRSSSRSWYDIPGEIERRHKVGSVVRR